MPEESLLSVHGLTAGYFGPPIIEDVEFHAARAKITALVGPNGAGKSTVLRAVAGVVRPDRGRVLLDGVDVTGAAPEALVRLGIVYVPQVANVFGDLSVLENLEMGGYVRAGGVRRRIAEICGLFPALRPALRRPARTLSGGERSMLAIARGLMVEPAVLLLDEPATGLAPMVQTAVWDYIEAVRDTGVAVVVVGQNTRRTLAHADWAYVLALGRIRLEGSGMELLRNDGVIDLYVGHLS